MTLRYGSQLTLALALLTGLAIAGAAAAQGSGKIRVFGGSSNNNDQDQDNDNNQQNGNRRSRNRNNDDQTPGGLNFGGSDAQKIQQAIQTFQGNPGQQQQSRRGQQGSQFKNNQRGQNFQQNNQGNWSNQNRRRRNNMQNWSAEFGGSKPFSNKWYNDHPQAWHHHHHHDNDAWEVATAVGVLGWLGWGGNAHHHVHDTTVIYQPVPAETIYIGGQPPAYDPHAPGEWMTIGVYSLMNGPSDEGTRLVQLLVDKHGHIRGNHFDTITNTSNNLTGRIHEPTQQVQWRLDTNKQLIFFTPLDQLTQPNGVVYVQFPSGQQQQWEVARMEDVSN